MQSRLRPPALFLGLAASLTIAGRAIGQEVLWYSDKPGGTVRPAGDFDGDGWTDLLVGPGFAYADPAPEVRILSGRTAQVLQTIRDPHWDTSRASTVAALGDVDGDGVGDVAVGTPTWFPHDVAEPRVTVYSGATTRPLWKYESPTRGPRVGKILEPLGDVDADGVNDLAIGMPDESSKAGAVGHVVVLSGASGRVLHDLVDTTSPSALFGADVGRASDADGDGADDLLIGNPVFFGGGEMRLVSSRTGATLRIFSTASDVTLGVSVAQVGDFDQDGRPDYAVGDPHYGSALPFGRVLVFGSTSGLVLATFLSANPVHQDFGSAVSYAGDLDLDGVDDLMISSLGAGFHTFGFGDVELRSGATGQLLNRYVYAGTQDLEYAGDLTGDGRPELILGGRKWSSYPTQAQILAVGVPGFGVNCSQAVGIGCIGLMRFEGVPSVNYGPELVAVTGGLPIQRPAFVLWSFQSRSTPYFGTTLCLGAPIQRMGRADTGDWNGQTCSGFLRQTFSKTYMRRHGMLPGTTVHVQAWMSNPGTPLVERLLTSSASFTVWP